MRDLLSELKKYYGKDAEFRKGQETNNQIESANIDIKVPLSDVEKAQLFIKNECKER